MTPARVRISRVRGRRERAAFVAFPYELHRHDHLWTPPLRRDVRAALSPARNPFFDHAEVQHLLAWKDGGVAGRMSAIHNGLHNEFHADRVGFFGFFECVDDAAVAAELFEAAADWLRRRGLETVRGPVSFSTNDETGLLVQGFDTPPVVMMPHNPPYYARLVEACGFGKVKDLLAYQSTHDRIPERLVRGAGLMQRRYGITTRHLDMRRFAAEVNAVRRLYNRAWERNWGFVPLTDREIDHLAAQLRPIVVPELVVFAERAGETIGFAAAIPDLNVALRANPSGRLFPGILRVLWAARKTSRLRVLMLGTLPEWRGRGVDALLYKEIWENGLARGYHWAEAGWVLEDNHPMRNGLEQMGFEVYKTYRLYDRGL